MKITRIRTTIARVPLGQQQFLSSQCAFPERNSLLVRVDTDEGICGWGEGGQYGPPEPVASCINHVLAPLILGRNPLDHGRIGEELYAATRDFGQKGPYVEAMSAIDIALWDIAGKALGEPVCRLLGGAFRDSIPAYATGCYYRGDTYLAHRSTLADLGAEAKSYVAAGFRMLKMKVGLLRVEDDCERVAAVREAVGPDCALLVDANHAYNAMTAVHMARGLEPHGVRWFEEPVPPEDRDGYRRVRSSTSIPIAGGECESMRYGFRDLIAGGCVDIVQPDLCVAGGFSEWLKIVALAGSFGVWAVPHVWGSGVALAAALHAVAALAPFPHTANPVPLQNEPVIEFDRNYNPLRDDLLEVPIRCVNGRVAVPAGPGLGISIDEELLERFSTPLELAAK